MRFNHNRSGMKRLVAYVLILAMLLTIMPISAFAKRAPKLRLPAIDPAAAEAPAEAPEAAEEAPAEPEAPAAEEAPAEPEAPEAPAAEEAPEAPAAEDAPEAPEAPEEPAAPESPAIVQELKVGKLTVSIDAEPGAFPEGTKVKAKKADVKNVQKSIDAAKDVDGKVLVAVDISFTLKGEELQPAEGKTVKVSISAPELKDKAKKAGVVHIDGETNKPERIEEVKAPEDNEVSFDAESFSIYAIIEGSTDDYARATVNFFNKDGEMIEDATCYVKNGDERTELDRIVVDPGIGGKLEGRQLFVGWYIDKTNPATETPVFDTETERMTIDDVRDYLEGLAITEGDVVNVYPMIFTYFNVTYFGEDTSVSLGNILVLVDPEETSAQYTVNMSYIINDNQKFDGWNVLNDDGSAPIAGHVEDKLYPNGTEITISGDIEFTVKVRNGNWLVFHENGKGGQFTAPKFFEYGESVSASDLPSGLDRYGYDFAGWYYFPGEETARDPKNDGDEDDSRVNLADATAVPSTGLGELTHNTHLYADWTPKSDAPFTVLFWIQNTGRTGYDFGASYVGRSNTNQPVPWVDDPNGQESHIKLGQGGADEVYFTGFKLVESKTTSNYDVVRPEGDTVLNLYFDRIEYSLRFYMYRRGTNNNTYTIARNSYTGQNVWGIAHGGGNGANWDNASTLPTYTDKQGNPVALTESESIDGYVGFYFTLEAYYGEDISGKWPTYDQISNTTSNNTSYAPVSFIMMNGAKLKPLTNGTGSGTGTDTVKGIIPVLDENILGDTGDPNGNYLIVRFSTYNSWRYHVYVKQMDGEDITGKTTRTYRGETYYEYDIIEPVRSSNAQYGQQSPPKIEGLKMVDLNNDNRNDYEQMDSTNVGGTNYLNIAFYYTREAYPILYQDSLYVDGEAQGNIIEEREGDLGPETPVTVLYGQAIPESVYTYEPTLPEGQKGYVFEGWYVDEACQNKFEYDEENPEVMVAGRTVYAKWRLIQYRVFLHPNAETEETNPGLDWGSATQQMSFRGDYGETISLPTGKWTQGLEHDYDFMGWYKDKGLNDIFIDEYEVLSDQNETLNFTDYDQDTQITDPIDKWGVEGTEDRKNSDKNNNRFWITQRLDLYAKWSERLVGAQGIHVLYDATEDGKFENVPEGEDDRYALDTLIYLDNSKAIVGPATVPNDPSKDQFLFWVVQEWVEDASNPEGGYYKDVEPKIELSPGNNFSVLARYAKIEPELDENGDPVLDAHGDPKQIYTVQLRAEYGPLEAPKTTYINWYRNHHDDDGEARLHRDEEKLINAPIDIYTLTEGIPERTGYTFLGWARESEYADDQMGEGNVPIEGAVPTTEVGDKPLYLKWVPATEGENGAGGTAAHYEAQDQYDEWVPVTQVAADEVTPYQAFYAIWEKIPTFKVIYASDVMNGTITDDKIYEFCVDDFRSEDDPDKPYLNVVNGVPSAETIKGETGKLIDVYTDWLYGGYRFATIGEDGAVSLGSYAYADNEDDPGNKIIPEEDMVYYVKNVDPGYLADYYKFTYIKKTKTITGLWFMSILDDLNYLDTGFVIWDKMYQDADGNETTADYYDQRQVLKVWSSLTVNSYDPFGNKTSSIKVSPSTVYNGNGAAPRLTYIGIEDIYDAETFVNTIRTDRTKAMFTIVPYWVTFDGIAVVGKNSRTITVHPNANDPAIRTDSALNADFEEWQEIVSTGSEGSGGD